MSKRICVFGDSIVWGANDFKYGGWVDRLKNYFAKTGQFNEVFNLGNPGKDTNKHLNIIEGEIKARIKPEHFERDAIILMTGFNDAQLIIDRDELRVSPDDFRRNLKSILKICQKAVRDVVVVGLFKVDEDRVSPLPWGPNKAYINKNIIKYSGIIESICEKMKIDYIDVLDLLGAKDLDDGIHPNTVGHGKLFKRIKDYLIENKII